MLQVTNLHKIGWFVYNPLNNLEHEEVKMIRDVCKWRTAIFPLEKGGMADEFSLIIVRPRLLCKLLIPPRNHKLMKQALLIQTIVNSANFTRKWLTKVKTKLRN